MLIWFLITTSQETVGCRGTSDTALSVCPCTTLRCIILRPHKGAKFAISVYKVCFTSSCAFTVSEILVPSSWGCETKTFC